MSYVSLSWSDLDNMDKGQLRRAWRNSNSHQRLVIEKYVNETYPPGAAEAMIREYHRTLHRKSVANDPSRKRQTRSSLQRIETEAREGFAQEPTGVLRALAAQLPYGAMKAMIEDELTRRKHRRDPPLRDPSWRKRQTRHLRKIRKTAKGSSSSSSWDVLDTRAGKLAAQDQPHGEAEEICRALNGSFASDRGRYALIRSSERRLFVPKRDPSRSDARSAAHLAAMRRDARTFTVKRLKSIVRTSKKAHARKIARAELRRRGH